MRLKYSVALALFCASSAQANSVFINEIHYDNSGGDVGEFFEIAAPIGTDLNNWSVVLYNGNNGETYNTFNLTDETITENNGYSFLAMVLPSNGIQNGSSDGLALIDNSGNVVQFLSYEGSLTATNGPANGLTSDDIGVTETSTTPVGFSLQLAGEDGSQYTDFTWQSASASTSGISNNGQSFNDDGSGEDDTPSLGVISGSVCTNCPDVPKIKDMSLFDAASYYATAQTEVDLNSSVEIIKAAINNIISNDHKNLTYSDVWTSLTYTDEDPLNTNNVTLWYDNRSQAKSTNGSGNVASANPDNWNREHSWPKSHGFSSSSTEAYTDIHHLRPTDISINSSRGNLDFDNSDIPLSESPINSVDGDSFEPRDDVKGDVARMMFYMDTRYEGSGSDSTPDLQLVNRITTTSESKLGWLCTLAAWNVADPVDASEQLRNDRIYELQGNRNPFTDNPTWVEILYPVADCNSSDDGGGGDDGDDGGEDDVETGGSSTFVFINEIHYDNTGGDSGEAIEIAGPAGTDLTGMSLVLYNGSSSQRKFYKTTNLSGVLANQQNGFGTASFFIAGIQNGGPDGMALVDSDNNVIQFLSYEGVFEAVDGPAIGMTSTDIGVSETSSTAVGDSLQLSGTGFKYEDFTWQPVTESTFDDTNNDQNFVAPTPFINEIHYDNAGGDVGEAIEIAGLAGTDLDGMSLVLYNGSSSQRKVYKTKNLTGILVNQQNGFGTASFAIAGIQNGGPDGMALLDNQNNVIQFLSYEGEFEALDGPAIGMTSTDIVVAESSSTAAGTSLQLTGSGFEYSDFVWAGSSADSFGDINTDQTFGGSGGGDGPGDCCDEITFIHDVQGSGDISPLEGDTVLIEGIVIASFSDVSGFFVQEEDADADANPSTSEGIFVFYDGELPESGSLVSVVGDVSEFYERTQLTATEALDVISTGNTLPIESALSLPFTDAAQVESLEGMLVFTAQALVVTDNYTLGRFGQVTLSTERLFVPTNVFAPGSEEAIALEASNALNRIMLDDGDSTQNPEVVVFPTGGLSASNTLRLGDTVASLTGVVDFAFGDYRVIPTQAPTFVATNPRNAEPDLNLGNLKVASLNVLNYFNNIDDSGSICGPTASSSCRGADSVLEFERQKAKTVAAIVAMDADIMGLMEIENNGFSEGSAIADLVAGINAVMGAGTYSIVDPGAVIGTDAITVAFMYKPSVVSLAGSPKILDSSNSISDEDGVLFNEGKNRPSLIQEFALLENGETLVISVNHLKSKGSGCGVGDDDTTTGQGNCNLTRTRAAQALSAFLEGEYPDTATLIMGDLNAYAKEDPISALEGAGYTNLVNYFGGDEAYSYSFRGLLGYLDHALANNKALAKVVDVTEWHINADEPISLDYNVEFKAPANVTAYYSDDAYRMSDHDPVLIAMQFDAPAVGSVASADVNQDGSINFSDYFAILGMLGSATGDANFDAIADYDEDGVISSLDLQAWYQLFLGQ
jgi:predicted extracellular nuclease/endonuclease I